MCMFMCMGAGQVDGCPANLSESGVCVCVCVCVCVLSRGVICLRMLKIFMQTVYVLHEH